MFSNAWAIGTFCLWFKGPYHNPKLQYICRRFCSNVETDPTLGFPGERKRQQTKLLDRNVIFDGQIGLPYAQQPELREYGTYG